MSFPLLLLHIPALIAYLTSEHAMMDAFRRRQNACAVLDEIVAKGNVQKAVEKSKGPVKCPATFANKTLMALHEALSKNTPDIERPVQDPEDVCDLEAWTADRSFVKELFGMQIRDSDGTVRHLLSVPISENAGNSMVNGIRDHLGDSVVTRAPLVLVCLMPKKFVYYPFDFDFSGIKYALGAVTTSEKTMYDDAGQWKVVIEGKEEYDLETINDVISKEACVIAYVRSS
jgi:hypothetical protein